MKDVQVKLHINKDVTPVTQKTRPVPHHVREQAKDEIKRLQKLNIIQRSEGATPWVSPVVIIPKTEGVRLCVDSRNINMAIERERHPMPTIEDLIPELNGSTIFSKINLNKGYHQLELHPESRYITTFTTQQGLFRYKGLCFGINSTAEIFQKNISAMLADIPSVKNISDDIIIYSKDEAQHVKTVQVVFS